MKVDIPIMVIKEAEQGNGGVAKSLARAQCTTNTANSNTNSIFLFQLFVCIYIFYYES